MHSWRRSSGRTMVARITVAHHTVPCRRVRQGGRGDLGKAQLAQQLLVARGVALTLELKVT